MRQMHSSCHTQSTNIHVFDKRPHHRKVPQNAPAPGAIWAPTQYSFSGPSVSTSQTTPWSVQLMVMSNGEIDTNHGTSVAISHISTFHAWDANSLAGWDLMAHSTQIWLHHAITGLVYMIKITLNNGQHSTKISLKAIAHASRYEHSVCLPFRGHYANRSILCAIYDADLPNHWALPQPLTDIHFLSHWVGLNLFTHWNGKCKVNNLCTNHIFLEQLYWWYQPKWPRGQIDTSANINLYQEVLLQLCLTFYARNNTRKKTKEFSWKK